MPVYMFLIIVTYWLGKILTWVVNRVLKREKLNAPKIGMCFAIIITVGFAYLAIEELMGVHKGSHYELGKHYGRIISGVIIPALFLLVVRIIYTKMGTKKSIK